jgi:hypothetical protein
MGAGAGEADQVQLDAGARVGLLVDGDDRQGAVAGAQRTEGRDGVGIGHWVDTLVSPKPLPRSS